MAIATVLVHALMRPPSFPMDKRFIFPPVRRLEKQ
jgi:hypothetical protein